MRLPSQILTVLLIGLSSSAYAGKGGVDGGGGDARCAEYVDLANSIANTLVTIGQSHVSTVSSVIKVADVQRISRSLKCLPVNQLDRQARSYADDNHTDLLVSAWSQLNGVQKLRLTAHELSVLASYESDGEYSESASMFQLLDEKSNQEGNILSCKEFKYYRTSANFGDKCITSKFAIYERVSKPGFGEAWRGPDGVTWGERVTEGNIYSGQRVCTQLNGELPKSDDALRGEAFGFREILPNMMRTPAQGEAYWLNSQPTYPCAFYGNSGKINCSDNLVFVDFSIRCVSRQ
jgi:hypothetical protein